MSKFRSPWSDGQIHEMDLCFLLISSKKAEIAATLFASQRTDARRMAKKAIVLSGELLSLCSRVQELIDAEEREAHKS